MVKKTEDKSMLRVLAESELNAAQKVKDQYVADRDSFKGLINALKEDADILLLEAEVAYDDVIKQSDILISYYDSALKAVDMVLQSPSNVSNAYTKPLVSLGRKLEKIRYDFTKTFRTKEGDIIKTTVKKPTVKAEVAEKPTPITEEKKLSPKEEFERLLNLSDNAPQDDTQDVPQQERADESPDYIRPNGTLDHKVLAARILSFALSKGGVVTMAELKQFAKESLPKVNSKALANIIQNYFRKHPELFKQITYATFKFKRG